MPRLDFKIPETVTHVLQPIAMQTIHSLLNGLGLSKYFDDRIVVATDNMGNSVIEGINGNINTLSNRCDVTIDYMFNPQDQKWDVLAPRHTNIYGRMNSHRDDHFPIFRDARSDILVVEQNSPTTIAFEFAITFLDIEMAYTTVSALYNRTIGGANLQAHDFAYDYPIPKDLYLFLYQIYKLRAVGSDDLRFPDYIRACMGKNFDVLQSPRHAKENIELVVKRYHLNALGSLEYAQQKPEAVQTDSVPNSYKVNFTYSLQFARPDTLHAYFPCVVNNQLVPPEFYNKTAAFDILDLEGKYASRAIDFYTKAYLSNQNKIAIVTPKWDDFVVPKHSVLEGTAFSPLLIAAFLLDEGDVSTIDLYDLGSIKIHPKILEIIQLHGSRIFGTGGLFNIAVFVNDVQLDPELVTISDDLVVSIKAFTRYRRYHLVLSENMDARMIDQEWVPIIIQYRTLFPITIVQNFQLFLDQGFLFIDESNKLLRVIKESIDTGRIEEQVNYLVANYHTTASIYLYMATPEQFHDYITHRHSRINKKCLLLDIYIQYCRNVGLLTKDDLATGYYKTEQGYPFISNSGTGGLYGFNTPIRVQNVIIEAKRNR